MLKPGYTTRSILLILCILIFISLVIVNAAQSLKWDILWDAEIFSYVGWLVSEGLIPYRDIFECNFPGTLLLYSFIAKFLGTGDFMFRVFDLSFLFLIDVLIILYCKKNGLLTGILAASLFSCLHLSAGAWQSGQRDYLLVLFLLTGAYFCILAFEKDLCSLLLFLSGLFIGAGITIKPMAAIFLLAVGCLACMRLLGAKKRILSPLSSFIAGGCTVPLCIGYWLWANDGLMPFFDIAFNYTLGLYSQASLAPFLKAVHINQYFGVPFLYLSAFLFIFSIVYCVKKRESSPRIIMLLIGIAYGLFHVLSQGKYFIYHYYPLAVFTCMLASVYAAEIKLRSNKILGTIILCVVVFFIAGQGYRSYKAVSANILWKNKYKHALEVDILQHLPPEGTLQPLLFTGMHQALWEIRLKPLTRFIYDFHFYHDANHPYIQKIRREFIKAMTNQPPSLILLQRASFPSPLYERIDKFPEFSSLLQSYDLVVENEVYRIYQHSSKETGPAGRTL